ncbi:fimbrial protein SthA [Salmonella enterica subsp. enterica serovar Senftenberg]|nr:fimbrial protein SthA [Salmonella enterica subsp. enterica serovar Senftenberg]
MLTAVASTPVFAQNTITFNGKIYDQACTVQVNGSTDTTIDLGNYSKERIAEKGATTDYVPFTVSPLAARKQELAYQPAMFRFHGATDDSNPTYFKTRTKDRKRAPRVSVFIQNASHSDVTDNTDDAAVNLPTDGSTADFTYYAAMANDGSATVTGGDVSTQVTYTVSYQ